MQRELSNFLIEFRKEYRREAKRSKPNFRGLQEPQRYASLIEEMDRFAAQVLLAISTLPPSPGRKQLTEEDVDRLRKEFEPVDRLVWDLWSLIRLRARIVQDCHPEGDFSEYVSNLKDAYFSGNNLLLFRRHMALRAWFSRRGEKYRTWASEYYSRKDVQGRRMTLDEDAKRQYLRYWTKKGVTNPPPWKPRKKPKSNVIPFRRKTSSA